jgi:hypothetical protein
MYGATNVRDYTPVKGFESPKPSKKASKIKGIRALSYDIDELAQTSQYMKTLPNLQF